MHQTRPRSLRRSRVARRRSLFTLAATTGPSQARIAGTASAVVFPLWVGPTTTTDWARSATTRAGRTRPWTVPRARRPGCAARCSSEQGAEVLPAGPAGAACLPAAVGPRHGEGVPGGDHGEERAAEGQRDRAIEVRRHALAGRPWRHRCSTSVRSRWLSRCWTRNEPCPTFHRATPRRSCGRRSASVDERESRSDATANSPGDWA